MKTLPLVCVLAGTLLGGCVLPIPTSHVAAPSIQGRVVHANTGEPIDLAGVTVSGFKEASVLTKRDGSFTTDQVTRSSPFWVWWPFSGDSVAQVELKVVRPGFAKQNQKVAWHPQSESHVVLAQPISLKPKSNEDAAHDLLKKLPQ